MEMNAGPNLDNGGLTILGSNLRCFASFPGVITTFGGCFSKVRRRSSESDGQLAPFPSVVFVAFLAFFNFCEGGSSTSDDGRFWT